MTFDSPSRELNPFARLRCVAVWLAVAMLALGCANAWSQDPEDEEDEFTRLRPGLIATYWPQGEVTAPGDLDQAAARRVDPRVSFVWDSGPPDPRLRESAFNARWQGRLFVMAPGEYRLHVHAQGRVVLSLAGSQLLEAAAPTPTWHEAKAVTLRYGFHPLEIEFESIGSAPRLSLFWEGPQFQLEPIPARHLRYDPADFAADTYRHGKVLVHAAPCAACHEVPQAETMLPSPGLQAVRGNMELPWMADWLSGKADAAAQQTMPDGFSPSAAHLTAAQQGGRRMPHFDLTAAEANAVTAYLSERSLPAGKLPRLRTKQQPDARRGALVLHQVGCLACHRTDGLGTAGLFDGGDLSAIAAKRPAGFFARWLKDPAAVNPAHRMPVVRLNDQEVVDLAAYLSKQGEPTPAAVGEVATDQLLRQGRQIIEQKRCAACHQIPGFERPDPLPVDLVASVGNSATAGDLLQGCFVPNSPAPNRPTYRLSRQDQQAVAEYLRSTVRTAEKTQPHDGSLVLAERNCLACHAREDMPGIEPVVESITAKSSELAPLTPALKPPALFGVGDKLHAKALEAAIATRDAPLRPWLAVRMPKFNLEDAERQSLVRYLIDADRIPDRTPETPTSETPPPRHSWPLASAW